MLAITDTAAEAIKGIVASPQGAGRRGAQDRHTAGRPSGR
jgi:hypothetical protein